MNNERKLYMVSKKNLINIAGVVWCSAGFNVMRLGIMAYSNVIFNLLYAALSVVVLTAFGFMFLNMSKKHIKRITGSEEKYKPFWTFFDLKSYFIMAFMMSGGIWLRTSHLASDSFIAFFYTGLGSALTLAGISFWKSSISYKYVTD